jgi:hypothetical protein
MVTLRFATSISNDVGGLRKSIRRRCGALLRATMRTAPVGPKKIVGFEKPNLSSGLPSGRYAVYVI